MDKDYVQQAYVNLHKSKRFEQDGLLKRRLHG